MELSATITQQQFNQDMIQSNLRDIFEPNSYIVSKPEKSRFSEIKTSISEMIESIISPSDISLNDKINEKFLELDFGSEFTIDATKIGINDAIFFVNLLKQDSTINYSVENNILSVTDSTNKQINATASLLNVLQTSIDTKKPIRLDFDNDVTVILKLDRKGKIQAHFIPGTSEVEAYLKNNIACLKQNFDEQEINYSYLGYSKHKNNKENQNSKNKKRSNQ
ncbi:MAG: hypothetical protein IJW73_07665 [Candidatus Gastranaerophilales bacterium]|nr:hypothetical protein [Candidatus Gastranaerophilales bacterium]